MKWQILIDQDKIIITDKLIIIITIKILVIENNNKNINFNNYKNNSDLDDMIYDLDTSYIIFNIR